MQLCLVLEYRTQLRKVITNVHLDQHLSSNGSAVYAVVMCPSVSDKSEF